MPPAHPHCNCSAIEILDTDIQPKWSDTLHQPQPEETDLTGPPTVPFSPQPAPVPGAPGQPEPLPPAATAPVRKPRKPKPPAAPPKPQRVPRTTGTPVGDALDVQAKGKTKAAINEAIGAINLVHGDGALPKIPVKETKTGTRLGAFWRRTDGVPIKIDVSKHGDHPRMTAAHEIGHFLDYNGIPKTQVGYGGKTYRDFRHEAQFAGWVKAIEDSAAVTQLRSVMAKPYVVLERTAAGEKRYNIDKKHAKYLVSDVELWARSYAQYIAQKSQNEEMAKELEAHRKTTYSGVYGDQWSDDDFRPIAKAFDDLFKHLGWTQ